jgi:hypothetical protein
MFNRMLAAATLTAATLALILCAVPSFAQTQPKIRALPTQNPARDPASVVYIGNSFFYYNNGVSNHVAAMLGAQTPPRRVRQTMVTIGGAGFDWHDVDWVFRPNAIGRYSFGANNSVVMNDPNQKLFEVAVMMDCSACPLHPELSSIFVTYARKHAEAVRKFGAIPVFFMSWAYQDMPEMTAALAEAYTKVGNDNDALVIPAGLAFARAVKERPDLNLYTKDKRHPTAAGTVLASATIYAALFSRSPVGLSYETSVSAADINALQAIAWATTQDYYKP